jgi:catechol 2,3-dioxygenase-like lactoylglutathione lyase family enzyme
VITIDHVVIAVSDWDRSNSFYRDVAGAELVDSGQGTWRYRFGTQQLNVHGPGAHPSPVAVRPVIPGGSDLCLVWEGTVEGALSHLRAHGVELEEGPVARHGAQGPGTSVYFRDPDGTLLEFIVYDG